MDTETPQEVLDAAALAEIDKTRLKEERKERDRQELIRAIMSEMKESEFWTREAPGIKGWTIGDVIENLVYMDEFDPDLHSPKDIYFELQRKLKEDQQS
jgi:hypothetical protein